MDIWFPAKYFIFHQRKIWKILKVKSPTGRCCHEKNPNTPHFNETRLVSNQKIAGQLSQFSMVRWFPNNLKNHTEKQRFSALGKNRLFKVSKWVPSLKLKASLPLKMDCWNTNCLVRPGLFSQPMLVAGRVIPTKKCRLKETRFPQKRLCEVVLTDDRIRLRWCVWRGFCYSCFNGWQIGERGKWHHHRFNIPNKKQNYTNIDPK